MGDDHLRSEHYLDIDTIDTRASLVARSTVRHLTETCPECRREWDKLGPVLQQAFLSTLDHFSAAKAPSGPDDDNVLVDDDILSLQDDHVEHLRHLRRRAYEQLWKLRRLPADRRGRKIKRAYRQFRSRAVAELLIEESRSLVRAKPQEALDWIELVPLVLSRTSDEESPWAPSLRARATAHKANTLRVLGDHPAAERIFVELRRSLAAHPVGDPAAIAEITSLEASLRMAQRRHAEAEDLLDRAALAYQYANDAIGLARARIKQAILVRNEGRPAECLPLLEQAAAGLRSRLPDDPYLHLSIVTERINALCDLRRCSEARRLLARHLDDYEASEEPFAGAILRCLEGRIALGLREFGQAEQAFESCRDGLQALGRNHDAALASLFLAEVYLEQGRAEDLKQLAAQLVARFRSSQLAAETSRAIDLFARAVATQRLSAALLASLRREISAPKSPVVLKA